MVYEQWLNPFKRSESSKANEFVPTSSKNDYNNSKNEPDNSALEASSYLGRIKKECRFLEEMRTRKFAFEIFWSLVCKQ